MSSNKKKSTSTSTASSNKKKVSNSSATTKKKKTAATAKQAKTKTTTSNKKKTKEEKEIEALEAKLKELKCRKPLGCCRLDSSGGRWSFTYRSGGKQICQYFSVSKLGTNEAKRKAYEARLKVFPYAPKGK
jgi:hypothetical protein